MPAVPNSRPKILAPPISVISWASSVPTVLLPARLTVRVPCSAVTVVALMLSSGSLTDSVLPVPVNATLTPASVLMRLVGSVLTGGSLMPSMVMVNVAWLLRSLPSTTV